MWLYGYVAMWLCGYVDQFQKFKFLNFKDPKSWVHTWSTIFEIFGSQISKDNIFPGCSHILSNIFEVFWHKKSKKYGVYGPRNDQ